MLTELRVQNLAVIEDARLELTPGLNVLTGETGAGKSLLVDALALLLGERADSALVRKGAGRAVVEGVFEVHGRDITKALDELGIELDQGRLICKREVQSGGRSRAWINGSPVTAGVLSQLGALLVDLHGQHDTQSLLHDGAQRDIVDAFAGASAEVSEVQGAWQERERLAREREAVIARQAEARKRADYLRHVADEIGKAAPKPGELEQLEGESRRLNHAEELGRIASSLADLLAGEDGAEQRITLAGKLLASLARIDEAGAAGWTELLEQARVNIAELERAVREYADAVELDPARLAIVEQRRDRLFRLDQKYGPGLDRVLAAGAEAKRELELLDTADADLAELGGALAAAETRYVSASAALTAKRKSAAKRLGPAVSRHLGELGMPGGTVRVALEPAPPGPNGAETVRLMCTLNPGMGERAVAKAASGGELSRLMLALKAELARHDRVPTLVFDEVDAGIGGQVAGRVADALAQVAQAHQVLVITHLPQIAAAASRHLVVTKGEQGVAQTDVQVVHGEDRIDEVARMLGGASATARKHAAEMLKL